MRPVSNRPFRIERRAVRAAGVPGIEPAAPCAQDAGSRHAEIMAALDDIRARLGGDSAPAASASNGQLGHEDAQRIRGELAQIHDAIQRTKEEIAALRNGESKGVELSRMSSELNAIVSGTEQATESILQAAEQIDTHAGDLATALKQSANRSAASDIQDQVVRIFEACNFQDLTGQRVTKVLAVFAFIEERVTRMVDIWGGMESFADIEIAAAPARSGDAGLLNGPALESDEDIASQDDIDALFG